MGNLSFLFLSASTPWVDALAEALGKNYPTHAAYFYDWLTYRRLCPSLPNTTPPVLLKRSMNIFPPSYAGKLEWLFRLYLQQQIQRWCYQLQNSKGNIPG